MVPLPISLQTFNRICTSVIVNIWWFSSIIVLFENEQIVLKESGHHSLKVKKSKTYTNILYNRGGIHKAS